MVRPFLRVFGYLRADGTFEASPGWETGRLVRRCRPDPLLSLAVLDDAGAVVATGPVERRAGYCAEQELRSASSERLTGHVVLHPRAATLVLSDGLECIHTAAVCAEKPRIHRLGVHADGDDQWLVDWEAEHALPLSFNLFFVDPLRRVIPAARGLRESSYRLETQNLPGGGDCSVALLATDGVRSECARSEPFHLPSRPPNLYMLAPADAEILMPDQPFSLLGTVHDLAGRTLPNAGISWSIDGETVAAGDALALGRPLEPGDHRIEMAYREEGKVVSSVQRSITVAARSDNRIGGFNQSGP